jgi:DnaK suppressor protein
MADQKQKKRLARAPKRANADPRPERSEGVGKRAQVAKKRTIPAQHRMLYSELLETKRRLWEEVQQFIRKEREGKPREDLEFSPEEGRGVVDLAAETEYVLVRRKNQELFRIEETLRRIEEGDYGVCEDCGKEIPVKRLQLMPSATRCTQCQELEEQAARNSRNSAM